MAITLGVAQGGAPDERLRAVDAAMQRHRFQPDALIEVLREAQAQLGHLPRAVLARVARALELPPSRVYGVATFYHLFSLRPGGRHRCTVCLGTACYVNGAGEVLGALADASGIGPGETTADGDLSLLVSRCMGACGIGPAVAYDRELAGRQTPGAAVARLAALRERP